MPTVTHWSRSTRSARNAGLGHQRISGSAGRCPVRAGPPPPCGRLDMQVVAHVRRIGQIVAFAVELEHETGLGPVFVLRVHLEDLRAGVAVRAAASRPSVLPVTGSLMRLVGKRELVFGVPARDVLAMRPPRLREAVVHEDPAAAADPVQHAVEGRAAPAGSSVEAEPQEVVHRAARLRDAERVDEPHVPGERIGLAQIVSVPRCRNVARSRIAAKPIPVTSGSLAVYVNSYSRPCWNAVPSGVNRIGPEFVVGEVPSSTQAPAWADPRTARERSGSA